MSRVEQRLKAIEAIEHKLERREFLLRGFREGMSDEDKWMFKQICCSPASWPGPVPNPLLDSFRAFVKAQDGLVVG